MQSAASTLLGTLCRPGIVHKESPVLTQPTCHWQDLSSHEQSQKLLMKKCLKCACHVSRIASGLPHSSNDEPTFMLHRLELRIQTYMRAGSFFVVSYRVPIHRTSVMYLDWVGECMDVAACVHCAPCHTHCH